VPEGGQARLGLGVEGPDPRELVEQAQDLRLKLADGTLTHHQLLFSMTHQLAEPPGTLLELLHHEPGCPGAIPLSIDRHLLLAPACHQRVALPLQGVEPGAHVTQSLGVSGRPDRQRGLLHRVAEMAIPVDKAQERAPLGSLVPFGSGEILAGAAKEGLRRPLRVAWRHRRPRGYALARAGSRRSVRRGGE
jgi:hypothetical protein